MSQSMKDREISPSGLEFQPGTRQASSLVEIPTPRVRFPYPTWTLMMNCYNPSGLEFQPGTRQASSLVEIPTPRVRFPYPTRTLMMDCYTLIPYSVCHAPLKL